MYEPPGHSLIQSLINYLNSLMAVGKPNIHPAGDVTRVSIVPRKVTVKIGDAENR